MEAIYIIWIALALISGTILGFFLYKKSSIVFISQLQEQLKTTELKLQALQTEKDNWMEQKGSLEQSESNLKELLKSISDQKSEEQKALEEKFENLANRIIRQNSEQLRETHQEQLTGLLKPFREQLGNFERRVEETHKEDLKETSSLKTQIKRLEELNQTISIEAQNLTLALKGQSKTQGNWGEMILERILEKSGLIRDQEYLIQQSYTGHEGGRLQPDIVIMLPEAKNLVIDSKVSLAAYERYVNAEQEEERSAALNAHLLSVRRHIKELSEKNYQQIYDLNSLDFVMMFIPVEPAFNVAVNADPDLYTEAFNKNIIIISNATLLATLRTVSSIWRQEKQNRNALKIAEEGGKMFDKLSDFVKTLEDMGRRIGQLHDTYDKSMKQLKSGRGSLLSRAEKMKTLGAKTSKQLTAPDLEEDTDDLED